MLESLAAAPPIVVLRSTPWLYGLFSALHLLGISALFGAILTLDLRLLCRRHSKGWRSAVAVASRISAAGLVVAVATGCCLFAVHPMHYLANGPFVAKLALVAVGVLNAVAFHRRCAQHRVAHADRAFRASALLSAVTWTAAIFCGRFIAFS